MRLFNFAIYSWLSNKCATLKQIAYIEPYRPRYAQNFYRSKTYLATKMDRIQVLHIPTLSDNYAYLFYDKDSKEAGCVDPAEPEKVVQAAAKNNLKLKMCLCTHKHSDHSGGNILIKTLIPDLEIYGSSYESTPGVTHSLKDNDEIKFGSLRIKVLHTACHTAGHLLYNIDIPDDDKTVPILFTGDTLFIGGCGRFFEGDAQMMHKALSRIASLNPQTRVFCGHEYTVNNLKFAKSIEPQNVVLEEKLKWSMDRVSQNLPTIPSTISEELAYNPFMRVQEIKVQNAVHGKDSIETMQKLRDLKNAF